MITHPTDIYLENLWQQYSMHILNWKSEKFFTPKKKKSGRSGYYSFEVRDLWYALELLTYRSEKLINHNRILWRFSFFDTLLYPLFRDTVFGLF